MVCFNACICYLHYYDNNDCDRSYICAKEQAGEGG